MRKQFILFFLFLLPLYAQTQYLSDLQRFNVLEKKGCAGLDVIINDTNLKPAEGICGPGNPCDITWGDGATQQIITNTVNHTYAQPGTYTLRVLYQNFGFDQIQIVVTPNTQPTFNIFTCGGNEVQVRVTDTNYDAYIINYNDGSPEVQVPKGSMAVNNHPYAVSGNKTVSVRGKNVNAADNCNSANQNVQAMATLPAPFINELEVISGTQIDFELTTLPNIQYRLEIATNNNTTFQVAQTVYNNITASVTNLRTDDNFYCFRLGAFDPCNNTIAYSNIVCSANFDAIAQNNINTITWITNTTGVNDFSLSRDGSVISNPLPGTSFYADNAVECKSTYCYQLITNYTNSSRSISSIKCATAFSSDQPTAITNATAVVTNSGVDISWLQDPAFQVVEYSIFRKVGSGNYQLLSKPSSPFYTDTDYSADLDYCYQINYIDVCDNVSPMGIEICLVRLTGTLTPENYVQLTWTEYTGWENGVAEYVIEKYSEQGLLLQTFTVGPGVTSYLDSELDPNQQVTRYIVKANPNTPGLGQAVSNEIIITKEPKVTFPTAFTPDNQGAIENEAFRVFGQYIATFEMQVFNRWGELIFVSKDIDIGWDGTYKGKDVQEGTYAFIVRLTDLTGNSHTRTGSVVLIRKK